ncbi:phosphate ABC transporter permease PstA [Vallitalea guaymasensis]|uniref:Phosphate transport system permease protein PstA n=1 Tax=Vallitalea guaymasensis TaxID=1185412 RepID=A0A8J8M730_9FIRM|nr:phosphate ABC transporter permease PstA [Vallitalea guaymasensis]
MNRSIKDKIMYGFIGLATAFTVGILLWIIGFVFVNGLKYVNLDFITSDYDSKTTYVTIPVSENSTNNKLGIDLEIKEYEDTNYPVITSIDKSSKAKEAVDKKGEPFKLRKGDIIKKVGGKSVENLTALELNEVINNVDTDTILVKVTNKGEGIFPMLITTLLTILLSLIVACPIGIFAAIYLTEYAKPGRLVRLIRFATESLAGIPSIIFGLFGMIFFVIFLKFNYSILAGSLTLSIILLPVIIRQTEESLKAIPNSYREGSLGLGATKLQTIRKVILPNAVSGIVVAIILSIGRIVGESAALLLTAGTVARVPNNLFSSGATLTVKAYAVAEEQGDIGMACAIGSIVVILILILNTLSKLISRKLNKSNA